MEIYYSKIIESVVVLILFVFARLITQKLINRTIKRQLIQKSRSQIIKKAISFIIILIFLTILLVIWGVKQSDLAVFVGSVLTVIGVAMFAQWSILSNITASIVLFFNHSVKIGDTIAIMEGKEYEIQGKILDIGLFFITLETVGTSEEITLPNNTFLQKTIRKVASSADVINQL
ncbi:MULTISPECIES: mechanosensitive ion channel domain-containing protein [unclassified Polaribacter]|uniref:mechanosensitive ion channel domain-containing protein n=1 Tax=unclassified Polaribacter TaxID=196858 RepID=UPI0011BDD9DB|nr:MULTISPECIES: mechanosensitive ion channel domain-containing protein [unclassified Polaribacter]TXD52946.1 mechanosensitive ion channel [Polaribacter sp. IC063]TXD60963.1 mechanosensitive ion channel [Polaribacter sp. IC066]